MANTVPVNQERLMELGKVALRNGTFPAYLAVVESWSNATANRVLALSLVVEELLHHVNGDEHPELVIRALNLIVPEK